MLQRLSEPTRFGHAIQERKLQNILGSEDSQSLEHALLVPPQFKLLEAAYERDDWLLGSGRPRLARSDLRCANDRKKTGTFKTMEMS